MSELIESYSRIIFWVQQISDQIKAAEQEIAKRSSTVSDNSAVRIKKLEEQLEKIDDYLLKVRGFQELAKKNLDSQNVLTIEAPPGYRVNLNRLRNWAMMIDPTSSNDPYAQRVNVVAKCDEHFLLGKQKEFRERIEQLKAQQESGDDEEQAALKRQIAELQETLRQYVRGEEMAQFAKNVTDENDRFWYVNTPVKYRSPAEPAPFVVPGAYEAPLPVNKEERVWLKAMLGRCYNAESGRVMLPLEVSNTREFILNVYCSPARRAMLDKAVQHFVLSGIGSNPAGSRRFYVLDGVRFSSAAVGSLKQLAGSFAMAQVPRNPDQLTAALEGIISSFADMDEQLEQYDSVSEYNASVQNTQKLPLTTVVLYGWPSAFTGKDKEMVQRMMTNYERYGVSFVTVSYHTSAKEIEAENKQMPEYAAQNALQITVLPNGTTVSGSGKDPQWFKWYTLPEELPASYAETLNKYNVQKSVIGNEYINRVDMETFPPYRRGNKSIVLPYGVDSKDEMHSISFENENFASYLMGASGSGKSTLLHTLITGIIRNYHPDDVELWLADFKMSEFAQYIDPCPPHVKYILLDESQELVYDLIDKLTEKMMERQRFFMNHRDMKKVENVPSDIYMPVIFVILDEFSIMSQAVSESEVYKLRLQNLLAKGRALGIKFIFSSQTFTKGVAGLTQTAKDQIQTRIAMKNSYNEINETLELSSGNRTEQVKNWMDVLPPHYTLSKYRDGDHILVKRLQVMYFKGKGDEALEPQRKLIRYRNKTMQKVTPAEYDCDRLDAYVDKEPVIIDGNSYKAFHAEKIREQFARFRAENGADLSADDTIITFGAPRKMVNAKYAVISNESRENLLLIARSAEQACGMSILLTTMKSFALQGGNVQVWAYSKNRLYRAYKDDHFAAYEVSEGLPAICASISVIRRQIENKQADNQLIVMLGMEQICNDFGLIDFSSHSSSTVKSIPTNTKQYEASTEEQIAEYSEMKDLYERFMEECAIEELEDTWIEEGKSMEEIAEEEERMYQEYLDRNAAGTSEKVSAAQADADSIPKSAAVPEENAEEEPEDPSYNASEDFKYIVKQGSRFGYHFMLCLNDLSDLKMTQLQQDLFRHKLVFQISGDDSISLFASKVASKLPEHICQYSDSLEQYSLRPFIHEGVSWDGWEIDENGEAVNSIAY